MAALLRATWAVEPHLGSLPIGSAIDLGRFADPAPAADAMGCFITLLATAHPRPASDGLWALARECGRLLRAKLHHQRVRGLAPRRFRVPLLQALLSERLRRAESERGFVDGLSVSNLGRAALTPTVGPFTVERLHFSTTHASGLYGAFVTLLTLGDRLQALLSCPTPLIRRDKADALAHRCAQELMVAVGEAE